MQQSGGVGADAEHGGVGERQLPGVADQDVETDRQQHIDDDEIGNKQMVEVGKRRQHDRGGQQCQQHIASAERRHFIPSGFC